MFHGPPPRQRLLVAFSEFDTTLNASAFEPPPCFAPPARRLASYWTGWAWMAGGALPAAVLVVGLRALHACRRRGQSRRAAAASGAASSSSSSSVAALRRAGRGALLVACICGCYALAVTFEGPQVLQSNQPAHSFARPALEGGGFCFTLQPCEAFSGVFKPPWWRNPTPVVGAPPDTVLVTAFYGYLLSVALLGTLLPLAPAADARCRRPLRVWLPPPCASPWHTCLGEVAALLGLLALLWYYAAAVLRFGSLRHGGVASQLASLGSSCGHLLNLLIGLLLLPVAHALVPLGLPWERGVAYHRALGWAVVGFGVVHVALEQADWAVGGQFWANLLRYQQTNRGQQIWPWAVPMMEAVFVGVLLAALAALPPVRRRCYALFLALHLLVMPAFVVELAETAVCPA